MIHFQQDRTEYSQSPAGLNHFKVNADGSVRFRDTVSSN